MIDNTGIMMVRLSIFSSDQAAIATSDKAPPQPYVALEIGRDDSDYTPLPLQTGDVPNVPSPSVEEDIDTDLAVVRRIVKSHNAIMEIHSKQHAAQRRYVVLFPAYEAPLEEDRKKEAVGNSQQLNILFVDDEPGMLVIGGRVLKSMGHNVTVERDPAKALALVEKARPPLDLIITDFTMPNLTGDKLAQQITQRLPDLPIILCTGHTHQMDAEKLAACGVKGILSKPFTRQDLADAIANSLPPSLATLGNAAA